MAWPVFKALANTTHTKAGLDRDISAATFRRGLAGLLLLGLVVRALFMVEHAASPSFGVLTLDQKYYDAAARLIVTGQDLHQLRGLRPLLYPMFLAAIYKLGGAHGIDLAVVAQHLLGVLTGVLVALLGARLFRHRLSGIAGGLLYLLAPVPLYFEGELLIESSYIFLICAVLLLVFQAAITGGWRGGFLWLGCGAFTILTAQARANMLFFMAVFPLMAIWRWRQRGRFLPLAGLLGGILMAVPWGLVNRMQSNHFQMIPSAGGVNLYLGNKRTADGMAPEQERRVTYGDRYEDSVEIWAREEYEIAARAQGLTPQNNPMAISQYWTHRAVAEIEAAPAVWLRLMAKKCWLMFWNAEVPNNKSFAFLQTEFFWLRVLPVRWVVLLMLAPAGIWAAAKWGNRDGLFVVLVYTALYSVSNVAFFICDRYRYPIWPAMAIMAGGGLILFGQALLHRHCKLLAALLASMAVMASISLPNWFNAKLPTFARDYLFRSIAWYEKGRFANALADIDQSLALDPSEMTALHHRGNVLLALRRFEDARQDYERTLRLNSDDAGVWNNYGVALDGVGRTNDALAAFTRATQCQPPSVSAFLGLAFDLIQLGRLDEAASALSQLEKQATTPNAMERAARSVIARRKGDTGAAVALEKEARALDDDAAAWTLNHLR